MSGGGLPEALLVHAQCVQLQALHIRLQHYGLHDTCPNRLFPSPGRVTLHTKLAWLNAVVTMQIDVEGCELEVLQGIQPQHWCHINQVSLWGLHAHLALASKVPT